MMLVSSGERQDRMSLPGVFYFLGLRIQGAQSYEDPNNIPERS